MGPAAVQGLVRDGHGAPVSRPTVQPIRALHTEDPDPRALPGQASMLPMVEWWVCVNCGDPIRPCSSGDGRPVLYHSAACRQAAYLERKRVERAAEDDRKWREAKRAKDDALRGLAREVANAFPQPAHGTDKRLEDAVYRAILAGRAL